MKTSATYLKRYKATVVLILCLLTTSLCFAQNEKKDSLKSTIKKTPYSTNNTKQVNHSPEKKTDLVKPKQHSKKEAKRTDQHPIESSVFFKQTSIRNI